MYEESRERLLRYGLRTHLTFLDIRERKYCRMANDIIPFSPRRCSCCPLWNGECRQVGCTYYDLEGATETSSAEEKRRTEGLIKAGIVKEFPEFLSQDELNRGGDIYEKALVFAAEAHKGAKRKGSKVPFIVHPVEVSSIVGQLILEGKERLSPQDYEIMAAAALHDVVEDTDCELNDIYGQFGGRIGELVEYETEDKRPGVPANKSWHIRKEDFLKHLRQAPYEAKMICMGDKLSNMRDLSEDYRDIGDECWKKFNNPDKKAQEWYYRQIAGELRCFEGNRPYQEYARMLKEIFSEGMEKGGNDS